MDPPHPGSFSCQETESHIERLFESQVSRKSIGSRPVLGPLSVGLALEPRPVAVEGQVVFDERGADTNPPAPRTETERLLLPEAPKPPWVGIGQDEQAVFVGRASEEDEADVS